MSYPPNAQLNSPLPSLYKYLQLTPSRTTKKHRLFEKIPTNPNRRREREKEKQSPARVSSARSALTRASNFRPCAPKINLYIYVLTISLLLLLLVSVPRRSSPSSGHLPLCTRTQTIVSPQLEPQ